jgi:DNA-binding protein YbaB
VSNYDRLYAFVREMEDNLRRRQAVLASFPQAALHIEIRGGVGTVTVDGNGQLRSVDLVPDPATAVASGNALGKAIVEAIRGAERVAAAERERQVAEATKELPPAEWIVGQ